MSLIEREYMSEKGRKEDSVILEKKLLKDEMWKLYGKPKLSFLG